MSSLKKIEIIFSVAVFFFVKNISRAEEKMSLHDCMAFALENSTKLVIDEANISDGKLERRNAILSAFTPVISAGTTAYYNFGRSIDPQTNTYFNQTSFYNNYSVNLGIDLFDGFKAVNNIKIAKTSLLISKSQKKENELALSLAVMEAYYNVVYYKRLGDVLEMQMTVARNSLAMAKRQEELGIKSHADIVEMEADLADREYDVINTNNLYKDQLMTLSALMFWPEGKELIIDTELPKWEIDSYNEEKVIDYALANNPGIKIDSWKLENARRELRTAKGQFLPTVSFYAGWSTTYYDYSGAITPSFGPQFRNNGGEYVQLAMNIPIYDGLRRSSEVGKRKNAVRKASAELEQKQRDVESEVRRAIQDCEGASAAYQQSLKKSWVQEEAYSLNRKKLEQGLISPLEFQTASNNYLRAKADEMNSLFKFLIKQAVVRYYQGTDYIDQI